MTRFLPTRPHLRPLWTSVGGVAVVMFAFIADAAAETPSAEIRLDEYSATPLGYYLLALGLGLLGIAAFYIVRTHFSDERDSDVPNPSDVGVDVGATRGASDPRAVPGSAGTEHASASGEAETSRGRLVQMMTPPGENGEARECPECGRRFSETLVLCPIDATPLQPTRAQRGGAGARRQTTNDDSLKPTCASCGRRYGDDVSYCYHDGLELALEPADGLPTFRVCRTCGYETSDVSEVCPRDGDELVVVDPVEGSSRRPTIPMMTCPGCNTVHPPSTTHCPLDGTLLHPLMNVRMHVLPSTGVGPRRRVCKKCGRRFSSSATFCAFDGSRLVALN